MLDSQNLKDLIINKILNKTDAKQIHKSLANIINLYLIENLQIEGNYVGQILSTPPISDPLNGLVKFRLMICAIKGQELLKLAKKSMELWYKGLLMNIQLTSLLLPAGDKVTLMAPSMAFLSISPSKLDIKDKNLQDTWLTIADTLINDIKAAVPFSTPLPVTSMSGGMGIVTLTKFD